MQQRAACGRAGARAGSNARGALRLRAVGEKTMLVTTKKPAFPFTAIQGQEEMKLALILNVVDSNIGGVLIMGDRGTGKSAAVRGL